MADADEVEFAAAPPLPCPFLSPFPWLLDLQVSAFFMAWLRLMTCPSTEMLRPSSLMDSDLPVIPSGIVTGTASIVRKNVKLVNTDARRTMIDLGVSE